MGTRLAALVLVPMIGLVAMSASITASRYQTASQAADLRDAVDLLTRLIAARSAIRAERVVVEIQFQSRAYHFDGEQTKTYMGFDPAVELPRRTGESDDAVEALGSDAGLVDRSRLAALRTGVADGSLDAATAASSYEELIGHLQAPIDEAFAGLERDAGRVSGGADVQVALDGIRALMAVTEAESDLVVGIEHLFLQSPDAHRWTYLIVEGRTTSHIAEARLDGLRLDGLREAWRRVDDGPDAAALRAAVDELVVAAPGAASIGVFRMIDVGKAGLVYQNQLNDLTHLALTTVHDLAVDLEQSAAADAARWTVFATALLVVTVGVSMRNARAISRPIRRLGAKAEAVSAGYLDVPPSDLRGPSDIVATSVAFDDVVANLRLLEAKSQALAACDFDAPVLETPLPGRLGESLQESVHVLSESIVERDRLQEHLTHQASHDALTGLRNRVAAERALQEALARAVGAGAGTAVLYVDLDDFKRANDTYGHAVGDEVLREVARRMASSIRPGDFLARLGGDEFLVLAADVSDVAGATALARHLVDSVTGTIVVGDLEIPIAACVGIAFAVDGSADPDQVLAWADLAVYRAKARGRGQIEIYDRALQQVLLERAATHDALRRAVERDELVLHYQPVVQQDGRLVGVEALVRWDRPGVGFQPPDSFIPAAETSSLIIDLDRWVMRRAARQLVEWQAQPDLAELAVAVNISGRHLLSGLLPAHLREVLEGSGVDPARLTLEITETVLIDDLPTAAFELAQVRDLGVRVAIDDFGTGYTSVMQLQNLPVDVMKIDRTFVDHSGGARGDGVLAMLIDLGHHLGLEVVGEGVETGEQLATLRTRRCDHVQGYFISRPLTVEAFEAWHRATSSGATTEVSG